MAHKLKTVSIDTMIDKHIGNHGSPRRDAFDDDLKKTIIQELEIGEKSGFIGQIDVDTFLKNLHDRNT